MAIAKRIVLFVATNLAVLLMLSLVLKLLGLDHYLTEQGIDYGSLMVFCAIWGMGGALISLFLSKTIAKWSMGVQVIDPARTDAAGRDLIQTVYNLARAAGLSKMPEVGVYESPEINAFATGPSKSNSLVAVSTGLLRNMDRREVEGVLSHEIAHIANGDMVTMTLIQGVVNAFVMFFARIVAFAVANLMRDEEGNGPGMFAQYAMILLFEMVFGLLGSMIVCWFSRYREFRADAGGARIGGRDKMISALQALQRATGMVEVQHKELATLKISGSPRGFAALLMTHPPLEARIARLRQAV